VYYPTPIHRLDSFRRPDDLPNTEYVAARCLSLPVHPALKQRQLDKIVSVVNAVAGAGS
jgi:dTDP-4-amino-4,6-dideoxygalactose transaminase